MSAQAASSDPSHIVSPQLTRALAWVGALAVIYGLLWFAGPAADLGLSRYLPMHTTMEMVAVIIAVLSFGIAWNAYAEARPGNVLIIGVALLGAALLDFGHALSYHGMPDFVTPSGPQKAVVFWLAARLLAAVGLLVVALRPWGSVFQRRGRLWLLSGVLAYVGGVFYLALYHPQIWPDFYVAGSGLTSVKVGSEYVLVAIYGLAAAVFFHHARRGAEFNAADLFAAAAIAVLSELCFTLYSSVSDIFNTAGHLFKIVCYGFIYRAVFVESVRQPFDALQGALDREKHWSAEQYSFVRTLDMLAEVVLKLTPDGIILSANRGWWTLAGISPATRSSLLDSIHTEDRHAFSALLQALATGSKEEFRGRFRLLVEGRHDAWIECRFVAERDEEGALLDIRGVLRDVTKTYLQERHIAHMAMHDALTNLPNRILLEDRIHKTIQLCSRNQRRAAVCFIDLDHFKNINDAYGHKAGDQLLQTLARVLENKLREGDTIARWGGDEFVVLLPDLESVDAVRPVAGDLVDLMRQTFEIEDGAVNATFSMGIAVYPDDGKDVDELLAQADRAMFYAKSQGRNNFQMYADMASRGLGRKELYIQSRLALAIREQRIQVWFQPLVAARPNAQGQQRLVGVEALARWHDPDLGWVSPATFIPMAESLGLISELGQYVQREALAQFRPWRQARPELHLSINVSKRQLFGPDFLDHLLRDAGENGIPPAAITLEVTESVALMEVEFAETRLQQLSAAGFSLSIDDFGTGYASLSQLHDLPVSELKIDISFVRRVHTADGLRMVQAIVSLAQALNLQTVAEGIEDEATAATLRAIGVDVLQGYHFGRPSPAAEMAVSPLLAAVS